MYVYMGHLQKHLWINGWGTDESLGSTSLIPSKGEQSVFYYTIVDIYSIYNQLFYIALM